MTLTFKRAALFGALALGLAAGGAAGAQDRPGGPGAGAGRARAGEPQKRFEAFKARRQQRLHDLLQIKPEQEPAFRAFLTAMEPPRREGAQERPGPGGPEPMPLTTPERLDRMAQRLNQAQQRFQQVSQATKAFYAVLSPEQKKAFDALPMRREQVRIRFHGGPGGPGGPGFDGPGFDGPGFGGPGGPGFGPPPR